MAKLFVSAWLQSILYLARYWIQTGLTATNYCLRFPCAQGTNICEITFLHKNALLLVLNKSTSLLSRYSDSLWVVRSGDQIPVGRDFAQPSRPALRPIGLTMQ
jgi:hypothetical protein